MSRIIDLDLFLDHSIDLAPASSIQCISASIMYKNYLFSESLCVKIIFKSLCVTDLSIFQIIACDPVSQITVCEFPEKPRCNQYSNNKIVNLAFQFCLIKPKSNVMPMKPSEPEKLRTKTNIKTKHSKTNAAPIEQSNQRNLE